MPYLTRWANFRPRLGLLAAIGLLGAACARAQPGGVPCDFRNPDVTLQVETRDIPNTKTAITDLKFRVFAASVGQAVEACLDSGGNAGLKLKEAVKCGDKLQLRLLRCDDRPIDSYEVNIPHAKEWEILSSGRVDTLPLVRIWVAPTRKDRGSTDSVGFLSSILLRWSSLFQRTSKNSDILLASGFAAEQRANSGMFDHLLALAFAPPLPPLPRAAEPVHPLQAACGDNYLIDPKRCFDEALRLAERVADRETSPDSYRALGVAQFANFQFEGARQTLTAGRRLLPQPDSCSQDAGSGEIRGDLAYYLAETALQSGRPDEAKTEADCALRISTGLQGGDSRLARDRALKARLLLTEGYLDQALPLAKLALTADTALYRPENLNSTDAAERAAAIAAARAVARDQELLGQIFEKLNRGEEAITAMQAARELDRKVHPGNPVLASSAEQLAGLLTKHGRGPQKGSAVDPAEEALRILDANFGEYNTHTSSGNYTLADSLYQQALTERNKARKKDSLERALTQAGQALRIDTLAYDRDHERLTRDFALTMSIASELVKRGFWAKHWKKVAVGGAVVVGAVAGTSGGGGAGGPVAGVGIPGGGVGAPP